MAKQGTLEHVGAVASFACAIHCALLPVLIGVGAAGTLSFLRHEPVEWGLVLLAAVVGTVSAWRGFRTHGNWAVAIVLLLAVAGLLVITLSHGSEHAHNHAAPWLGVVAGVALGGSLLVNRRLCRTCHDCVHDDPAPA